MWTDYLKEVENKGIRLDRARKQEPRQLSEIVRQAVTATGNRCGRGARDRQRDDKEKIGIVQ